METLQKRTLFWDIDPNFVDLKQNRRFVVERILARGDVDDIRWAKSFYGDEAMKSVLLSARTLDSKSLSFWCSYFNINKQQCIQKPSLLKRVAFWKK